MVGLLINTMWWVRLKVVRHNCITGAGIAAGITAAQQLHNWVTYRDRAGDEGLGFFAHGPLYCSSVIAKHHPSCGTHCTIRQEIDHAVAWNGIDPTLWLVSHALDCLYHIFARFHHASITPSHPLLLALWPALQQPANKLLAVDAISASLVYRDVHISWLAGLCWLLCLPGALGISTWG